MSFKTKSQKSSAGQLKNLYKTEYHYNKLALQCCEDDLIKLTEKQYQKLKSYLSEGPSYFGNFHVLSDSSGTTYKHAVYTPGLGGSPIQEQNQTSSKVMELISVLKLIRFFAAKKTTDEVQSVMVTLSFQNSDKGWLSDAEQCLKVIYTKLKDWFRKTCDFGHGQWIGMMPAMEVTVNKKHFKAHEEKQLYHQHLHLVLFFAGLTEHDIYSVRRQIFKKFSELCEKAGVINSSAAYGFEKTYAKKAEKIDKSSLDDKAPAETSPISAMLEATKYATKPADIEMVCKDYEDGKGGGNGEGNKFAEEVFAEIYNARFNPTIHEKTRYKNVAGKKATRVRLRGAGLYEVARSTYKAIAEAGLSGVFAFNKCDGDISLIPHVFTKFATLILEKNVAKISKKKDLTPNELLFYNKDMLKFSIMPSRNTLNRAIAKFGDTNPTPKQQAVVDVLKNFVRWNDSIDSIDEVLNEWIMTLTNDVEAAMSELKAGKVESEAIEAYKERIQANEYRKSDVEHLKNAMDNAASSAAETDPSVFDIVEKVKKTKLGKKVANYLPTDGGYQFLVRSFRNADIVVRVGKYAKKNLSKKLIDKFISDFSNGHWQYKEHDCAWMEPVISYYVQLTAGKTVKKGNSLSSLSQSDLSDIKNWSTKADTPDSRTWARYLVWLGMYYANADTERDRREAQLLGSLVVPRDVVLQMPSERLEGSIKHLMDKTRTNNPIFKGLYSVKTTQKAAA